MEQLKADLNSGKIELSLDQAKSLFNAIAVSLDPTDLHELLKWTENYGDLGSTELSSRNSFIQRGRERLDDIAAFLRQQKADALDKEEAWKWPTAGSDSECTPTNTVAVDSFLFNEEDLDELVECGRLTRSFCTDCGSKNTTPLKFISHSLSRHEVEFIFTKLMPADVAQVLDIGSRLGAVVYAASIFTGGDVKTVGVEINPKMARLSQEVVARFSLNNVFIVIDDIRRQQNLLHSSTFIVMNNVFSFFQDVNQQAECWEFLYQNIADGAIIVHHPSIAEATTHLQLSFELDAWLKPVDTSAECIAFSRDNEDVLADVSALHKYIVMKHKETVS